MAHKSPIKMFGELVLRASDLDAMKRFYLDVVGLEMYRDHSPDYFFLKVADGVEGHPQLLAVFDRPVADHEERKILDHFAFVIDLEDYPSEKARLEAAGVAVRTREITGFGWRSLFFSDPEGNHIEFVAYDPSVPSET